MSLEELELHLVACSTGSQLSQQRIYQQFYRLAMSVCLRYAQNREEAEEICNDGFVKVFSKIADLESAGAFKAWFCTIMVRAAIDYFRKYKEHSLKTNEMENIPVVSIENTALSTLSVEEKLRLVQQLSPTYRLVFNLYAIEGVSVTEIADTLQIAEGTVRANVAKARFRLQEMILNLEKQKKCTA